MISLKIWKLVEEMITLLVVYWIIIIFTKYYKMTVVDSSKQQAVDADAKAIQ